MFQNFETVSQREFGPERLSALRAEMKKAGVSAYLVPHGDEHQNEYLPERAERLAWLTGFAGSAGFAIATLSEAVVFVDGRYTLQVREQTDQKAFTAGDLVNNPPSQWISQNLGEEDVIGYAPWLLTIGQVEAFAKAAKKCGATLKATENLIDQIWADQPAEPRMPIKHHRQEYSGKASHEKLSNVQSIIAENKCQWCLLTDPASLAWLFNIRGNDVVHNPLALGFALVPADGKSLLFIHPEKRTDEVNENLGELVDWHHPDELLNTLKDKTADTNVWCDPALTAEILADTIRKAGGTIVKKRDPVVLPRAIKNETELEGAREAHRIDGVAMCRFLAWLDGQPPSKLTEIKAAQKLEDFRRENAQNLGRNLEEISFDSISAFGPHAAIPHYRVTEASNLQFEDNSVFLIDSGAQYLCGTTDITRTIAVGSPAKDVVRDFTLVLKGHIAIALARFPTGTRGMDLDPFARHALWQTGRDFAHGTGHGIGSYMNVHEGPQSLSKRGSEPLKPGMILSNEPGYYVEGKHGIRIENLVIVSEAEDLEGGNVPTHSFETITFTPIDRRLTDKQMLTETEIEWLNTYHEKVWDMFSDQLNQAEKSWLQAATAPL